MVCRDESLVFSIPRFRCLDYANVFVETHSATCLCGAGSDDHHFNLGDEVLP